MNYSILVFGAVILFSLAYYVTVAHKTYVGPRVELEVHRNRIVWSESRGHF